MKTQKEENKSAYEYQYKTDYQEDWDIHQEYISTFDAFEAMVIGQVYDSVSKSVDGSKITDSYATTLAKERADRVMAKLPEGETESIGLAHSGKASFLDIIRQKWIYPNANAQQPFFEKLNLWQFYSSVYGYMPMFYDWNVSPTGYVGPDCWLWSPRNLIPQQGRLSIADMDYVTALTWVSKKFLEDLLEESEEDDGYNRDAIRELIELAGNEMTDKDNDKDTFVSRHRSSSAVKKGICLATRYEAGPEGHWVTFAPDHGCVQIRDIENPHKNGRIPFVIKYSQPLFDSFYGLGDFHRAKPIQFARDGLTNFYFKGIKMNLIPPIVANANGVLKHTIDYREGAVMLETIPNSIRRLETSTAGLATFQGAMSNLTGSLLSQFGSQNAALPAAESLNPSQGKTPAAIGLYGDKEATRDGSERRHLETAIEQLTDGFFSLIANIGTETIPLNLFSEDVKRIIKSGRVDVRDLFEDFVMDETGTVGELRIDPEQLRGVEARFHITPNSTAKLNKEQQLSDLERFLSMIGKFQNLFKEDQRIQINWPLILQAYEGISNTEGAGEFIVIQNGPSPKELELMQQIQELQGAMQQMQAQQQAQQSQPQPVGIGGNVFRDPDISALAQELMQS